METLLAFVVGALFATIGFMLAGLGIFTRMGLAGSIFYVVEDMAGITNLFLIGGISVGLTGNVMTM